MSRRRCEDCGRTVKADQMIGTRCKGCAQTYGDANERASAPFVPAEEREPLPHEQRRAS